MTPASQLAILQEIIAAPTTDEVWARIASVFKNIGPHRFSFIHAPFDKTIRFYATQENWITQTWVEKLDPSEWDLQKAFEPSYCGPFFWSTVPDQIYNIKSSQERLFCESVAKAGYTHHLCFPIWGVSPNQQSLLSIMTKLDKAAFHAFVEENFTLLYATSHIIHARFSTIIAKETRLHLHLSKRERDCLSCLSAGLRNNRIAQKLGISESTIEFHTLNARRKLDAKTREEAISKALLLGLLTNPPEFFDRSRNRT